MRTLGRVFVVVLVAFVSTSILAQQTGSISGKVTADGQPLPGVTVEARSNVLPQPRVTVSGVNGDYQLPALQPGAYTLSFTLAGMQSMMRKADVLLSQNTVADVKMTVQGVSESVTVTAETTLVDKTSTEIQSGLSNQQIQSLPVGQEYRDLVKLIPGVQYSQDSVRGPSAGGSGQDNVYLFDGVNVTVPLYGTLASEASSHDIAQITTLKGGAKAVDFERSGGFTIDSVSKSGTNKFFGEASFQSQNHSMRSSYKATNVSTFDQDKTWSTLSLGGPILTDRLFFYGSYYRPTVSRNNQSNFYGALPKYSSNRNEEFGKLTFSPASSFLINGSYRNSKRLDKAADLFGATTAGTAGSGNEATLKIGTVDGSWVMGPRSFATARFTNFTNKTASRPDNLAAAGLSIAPGTRLDIANLDKLGNLTVPEPLSGETAYNAFIAPIITKYGYQQNGTRVGGGITGVGGEFDHDDFFRTNGQLGYNLSLGSSITHDLHIGYQRYVDAEELQSVSNGFGYLSVPGGRETFNGQPAYYRADFLQGTLGNQTVSKLRGEYHSESFELNDTIRMGNWSFNAGVLDSHDTLYGQGLRNDPSTLSGYVSAPGEKYKMYDVPFKKMIQPRLGATWAYNGNDTVYASVARYNPAASSLPRAAAWDRRYITRTISAYFDQAGNLLGSTSIRSSSGKFFQKNMDPRQVQEYLIGTAKQMNGRWSSRLYGRYRHADHFWEDTNNTARADYRSPASISKEPYIPNLGDLVKQVGSGSSYVIAQLDGAFTKYYEATGESEWHGDKVFLRGSYTWSHYYGNFDQDNTSDFAGGDFNTYIGSSFISDGPGRQLWDNKYGNLRGDRRHMLKLYGSYALAWKATTGAYFVYQSGQPWEAWSADPYNYTSDNDPTDDTSKFAEPAGSRRSPAHHQLDLNYTQNFPLRGVNLQFVADIYNAYNKQTGYAYQQSVHSSQFGVPRYYYEPRRFQIAARVQF